MTRHGRRCAQQRRRAAGPRSAGQIRGAACGARVQRGSRTEFTCAQRTGQGRGETKWQAEVVEGARGLPAMENGLWDGKSKFTAEMLRAD